MYLAMKTISAKLIVAVAFLFCLATHADEPNTSHASLPVVSATELDTLSAANIRQNYPDGISVFRSNLSHGLKTKLERLTEDGYTVTYLNTDSGVLQRLTREVINKSNITRYLIMAYDGTLGCSMFFSQEFVPHIMRHNGEPVISGIKGLTELTPEQLTEVRDNHHLWNNLGYETGTEHPEAIKNWLANSAKATNSITRSALSDCKVHLDNNQQSLVDQLISLDYLSNAVRGLFYTKQGHKVTHYRQLAVETLPKEK